MDNVVEVSLAPAGLRPRLLAFALDYLVMAAYLIVLTVASIVLARIAPALVARLFDDRVSSQLTVILTLTLPITLYFALFEASSWQATPGKRRLKLVVTDSRGQRLSLARSFARSVLKFIPWELAHTCIWQVRFATDPSQSWPYNAGFILVWVLVGANVVSLWLSASRQTLYDRLAGTLVSKRNG
ncbi:RDD family protein [Promineifilum sp.]|uniref:RDD family protein n=1 Tax=Promineifilum sp. TaxID=2664178 RepID=UPI0035ADFC07